MTYSLDAMRKDLEGFKTSVLLQLKTIEMKLDTVDEDKDEIKQEVKELKKTLVEYTKDVNGKIETLRNEMPHYTTTKIIYSVFGAIVSFLFAMLLLFMECYIH